MDKSFFLLPTITVAKCLLGKLICRQLKGEIIKYRIIETEAYIGESDTACHAHRGKTSRNSIMYEIGGKAYIYLCYGIHNLLNITTACCGNPEAILIRGVEGFNGPGKLTKAMKIDRSLNGVDLEKSNGLWIENDGVRFDYNVATRVGIDYADYEDREKLWRFIAKV